MDKDKALRVLDEFGKGFTQTDPAYKGALDANKPTDYIEFILPGFVTGPMGGMYGRHLSYRDKGIERSATGTFWDGKEYLDPDIAFTGRDKLSSFVSKELPLGVLGFLAPGIMANMSDRIGTGLKSAKAEWDWDVEEQPINPISSRMNPEKGHEEHGHIDTKNPSKQILDAIDALEKDSNFSESDFEQQRNIQSFIDLLGEHGYNVPRVGYGSKSGLEGTFAAGAYVPSKNVLLFREDDPKEGTIKHELHHYLSHQAGGGESMERLLADFDPEGTYKYGKSLYPTGDEYDHDPEELGARIAGQPGGIHDHEDRLVGMVNESKRHILGESEDKGTHKDIRSIVGDITSYHGYNTRTREMWDNLPFKHPIKRKVLDGLEQSLIELKKQDNS